MLSAVSHVQAEVDARDGVLEAPVQHGLQQRKQQCGVAQHLGWCQDLLHLDAAGLDLATALQQRLAQQPGQVQGLMSQ